MKGDRNPADRRRKRRQRGEQLGDTLTGGQWRRGVRSPGNGGPSLLPKRQGEGIQKKDDDQIKSYRLRSQRQGGVEIPISRGGRECGGWSPIGVRREEQNQGEGRAKRRTCKEQNEQGGRKSRDGQPTMQNSKRAQREVSGSQNKREKRDIKHNTCPSSSRVSLD